MTFKKLLKYTTKDSPKGVNSCIFCFDKFYKHDIEEYTTDNLALCPRCGIDSLVEGDLALDLLETLHEHYFIKTTK